MQTYGFCRIYDAKTGSFAALTRKLDFAACGIWFAAGVILSPARMTDALGDFYGSGVPFIAPAIIQGLHRGILAQGEPADLLLLDRDTGKDLTALRAPKAVFKAGVRAGA